MIDGFEPQPKSPQSTRLIIIKWTLIIGSVAALIAVMTNIKQAQRNRGAPLDQLWRFGTRDPELQRAIEENDPSAIRKRLGQISPTQVRENIINTLAVPNHIPALAALLDAGWSAEGPRKDNQPLFSAIGSRNAEIVKLLLDHGANANAVDASGESALMMAISSGFRYGSMNQTPPRTEVTSAATRIVALLLAHGADPDRTATFPLVQMGPDGSFVRPQARPIHAAAATGNAEVVKLLLERHADPNSVPPSRATALTMATTTRNGANVVHELMQHGAKADLPGTRTITLAGKPYSVTATALYFAAENGDLDAVKELLSHGADPHQVASDGKTALEAARGPVYRYLRERYTSH